MIGWFGWYPPPVAVTIDPGGPDEMSRPTPGRMASGGVPPLPADADGEGVGEWVGAGGRVRTTSIGMLASASPVTSPTTLGVRPRSARRLLPRGPLMQPTTRSNAVPGNSVSGGGPVADAAITLFAASVRQSIRLTELSAASMSAAA